MADSALETLLRRDRTIVAVSIATLTATAWIYVLWLAQTMDIGGMSMPMAAGMDMDHMNMNMGNEVRAGPLEVFHGLSPRPWTSVEALLVFVMWVVMMVGMMLPSATPMILLYARVGRQSLKLGKPFASTGFFAGGYLLAWAGFSFVAAFGQWLSEGTLLTPALASASGIFSGTLLVAAGLFQWTPLKHACLTQCQSPIVFLQAHGGFRRDAGGAVVLGFRHGLYCVGCCWALMALLFVGGIMNVLWIAVIAVFVLVEKLVPLGRVLSRSAGAVLIAFGLGQLTAAAL